ncbi:MAG: Gfo/Idh/MocA family oxidoreductase [Planctomycetota bacterium]
MASSKKLSVGVIGLGYWGPNLLRNFAENTDFELRWACDSRAARLPPVQRRYPLIKATTDPNALFADADLDAVVIATPVDTHFELASAALQANKHVLLEKPMTRTVAEADELLALAAKAQRLLMVDHTFLFTPAVQQIKARITRGELGTLNFIDSVRINLGIIQRDVNVLWDLAPHDLSIILHVLERGPHKISAVGASHTRKDHADVAHLYLDFGDNLLAHIHSSWLSPVKVRQMVFGGTLRTLIYNDNEPSEKIRLYEAGVDLTEHDEEGIRRVLVSYRRGDILIPNLELKEALANEIAHFYACVTQGQRCISDGKFGREIVRILVAADRSMRQETLVTLV